MKTEIVTFEIEHADDILERNVRLGGITPPSNGDWDKWVVGWKNGGPAFTLIVDGEVVGCAGVVLMDWGRGEAWALLSGLFYDHKKESYRAIRDGLNAIIKDKKLVRVQSVVFDGDKYKASGRFLEHLGFHDESPEGMQHYGPHGENVHMFARIMR